MAFDALDAKLSKLVEKQLAYRWTPPVLAKNLQASLGSVAKIGASMKLASPAGNATPPSAGRKTDALSLGVGVSASAALSISAGISIGVGFSATLSLGAKLITSLNEAVSKTNTLEQQLVAFNAAAQLKAGTNGVMPAGQKVDQGAVNGALRSLNDHLGGCERQASAAAEARPVSPIAAELRHPRMGAWHCDLELDADSIQAGKIKFQLDDLEFTGTVLPERTGVDGSRAKCTVVAGNGNLSHDVTAHSYSSSAGVRVGSIVHDILKECGEDLSDLSDKAALDKKLPRWHVTGGTAKDALTRLAEATDCAWRVLRDGTVWFGVETWPEVAPDGTLTNESWHDGTVELASETPNMVPGTVYQGQKIEHVVHRYGTNLRTEISTSSPSSAFGALFKSRQREVDYSREYPCKVVTQNPDGTVQLLPDDEVMKARGLDHVPIRYGMPGMKATIANGARCHLAFAAGDPSRPFVCSWEYDPSKVTLMSVLDGGQSLSRVGDLVQSAGPGTVVTLMPVAALLPGPLAPALGIGLPYLISFSAIPPTPVTATPLYGSVASGIPKFQG